MVIIKMLKEQGLQLRYKEKPFFDFDVTRDNKGPIFWESLKSSKKRHEAHTNKAIENAFAEVEVALKGITDHNVALDVIGNKLKEHNLID